MENTWWEPGILTKCCCGDGWAVSAPPMCPDRRGAGPSEDFREEVRRKTDARHVRLDPTLIRPFPAISPPIGPPRLRLLSPESIAPASAGAFRRLDDRCVCCGLDGCILSAVRYCAVGRQGRRHSSSYLMTPGGVADRNETRRMHDRSPRPATPIPARAHRPASPRPARDS